MVEFLIYYLFGAAIGQLIFWFLIKPKMDKWLNKKYGTPKVQHQLSSRDDPQRFEVSKPETHSWMK